MGRVIKDLDSLESGLKTCRYGAKLLSRLLELNSKSEDKINIAEIEKAVFYAKKYHAGQYRQSGEPYYSHPLEVAYMVADYLFRTDIIITAILHDTIEDTSLTAEMIESIFGPKVAGQVEDLTRIKPGGKISSAEMVDSLWLQKKYDVLLVKQFDRLHNMQTIGAKSPEKIEKIATETLNTFIAYAISTNHKDLEEEIYRLCCEHLSIAVQPLDLSQIIGKGSYLASLEGTNSCRVVSQVFQNITGRLEKQT